MRLNLLMIYLSASLFSFSQDLKPSFISASYTEGILIAHRPNMYHLVQKNNRGAELTVLWQRTDDSEMSKVYRMPVQGFNLTFRNFGNPDVLGNGFGITYVQRFILWQSKRNLCLEFQTQTGFGFLTKHYSKDNNPKNIAIGSVVNTKPDMEFRLTKFTKHMHYGLGIGFSHFSNGAMKNPNLGLNTAYLSFTAGYNFEERRIPDHRITFRERMDLKDDYRNHELISELIFTAREVAANPEVAKVYPVTGLRLVYSYRPRIKWGCEVSLDFGYNAANPHIYPGEGHTAQEAFQLGLYTGGRAYFYRVVMLFGAGVYLWDPVNAAGRIYDRLGVQYYFHEKFYTMFNIKAHFAKADYFEFGFGYKIKGWN